jgi:DTW domain-containing protein YfiP
MYRPLCLCQHVPSFTLKTRVLVLMHWREENLPTNTADLACLALPNSSVHIRGRRNEPLQIDTLVPSGTSALFLFPSEDAIELNEQSVLQFPKPLTLVVPDGSWRQAKKVALREKGLKNIPRVKLPVGRKSEYRLRHSPHEENLSTFEAIARALGVIESLEIQTQLEHLFLMMVERRLWSRGKLPAEKCTTGIPDSAFEAARLAGIAGQRKPL